MLLHPTDRVFQPAAMSAHILLSILHDWKRLFRCLQVRFNLLQVHLIHANLRLSDRVLFIGSHVEFSFAAGIHGNLGEMNPLC